MNESKITRELIPVSQMKVDSSTNTREPTGRERLYKKMVDAWRPELCQDLEVAPSENGVFEVIDGGTRLMAMRELGITSAWCRVHWGLTALEAKAELFRAMARNRNPIKALEDFRALANMGYEPAVAITKALSERGLMLTRWAKSIYGNAISCSNALLQLHAWGTLEDALDVVLKAWPENPNGRSETMVMGVGAVLRSYPEIKQQRLIARLSYTAPEKMTRHARVEAHTNGTGAPWAALYDLIVLAYSQGLAESLEPHKVPAPTYRRPEQDYIPRFANYGAIRGERKS